jgi:hypothetical protein
MTRRCTYLLLAIATLSCVPGSVSAAESAAQRAVKTSNDTDVSQITLHSIAPSKQYTITSDDWQRSGTKVSADLRFIKPKIPGASQSTTQPTIVAAKQSMVSQPGDTERQAAQCSATKRIAETGGAPIELPTCETSRRPVQPAITIISDEANDRERAEAAIARLRELIEQPEVVPVAVNASHEQPAEMQPVADTSTGAIRWTVDRLRHVAQKFAGEARTPLPRHGRDRRFGR